MPTEVLTNPDDFDPMDLVKIIQNDPDTFQDGRRNNDMVNWYVAKCLIARGTGKIRNEYDYIRDFEDWISTKDSDDPQRRDLEAWSPDWATKIKVLYRHYEHYGKFDLLYLWLPMDYDTERLQDPQVTGQTQIGMEG